MREVAVGFGACGSSTARKTPAGKQSDNMILLETTISDPNIGPPPRLDFFNLPVFLSSNYHQILYMSFRSIC